MLSLQDIYFSYHGQPVLNGLSLDAAAGECLVLAGPNGCGKSTALALMAGVLKPQKGSVTLCDRVGYVPQKGGLMEDMRVIDNLRFFAQLAGSKLPPVQPLGVDAHLKKRVSRLSGGMKKRVSIACALASQPRLLLLDEPCEALDAPGRAELAGLIGYLKSCGMAIVYVGHDAEEFAPFFDRLAFIRGGSAQVYTRARLTGGEGSAEEQLFRLQQSFNKLFI